MRRSAEMSQQQQTSSQEVRQEQRTTQQRVIRQQVQGMVVQEGMILQGYPSGTPPVFEKVFSNARFAQGGDALFEGRVTGDPKPNISWTRKGAPLFASQKHQLRYEEQTGNVSLLISRIGPGDEGEYTCTARNQLGEAMCSVYIQPEGVAVPAQGPRGQQSQQIRQTQQMTQMQTQQQQQMQTMQQTQQWQQQQMQTMQQRTQQTSHYANGFTTIEEDFKVDTFEYRLLREVSFRESLTRRYVGESDMTLSTTVERQLGPPAPPQLVAKPRNSKLQEGSDAVFVAQVPANPRPRLTWFKNGKRLATSQKHQASYSNQQATLRISQVDSQDSGHYTLLAENPQGCVVTSAYLAVEPSAIFEQTIERETKQLIQIEQESVEGKMIAPNFARTCGDRDVTEGKMTRFDCRVTGRPYPEVTWYINGRQVVDDGSHKILVNESGNHALMITNVSRNDSGIVTCLARNKAGETSFECKLNVIEKELVVAPKFVQRFGAASIKEGEPVMLTARAVGTPIPNITWQKDGVPITGGDGISISTSGGGSTLEIIAAKTQDAGWYQCMAQNIAGSTATRARVHVQKIIKQDFSQPTRLHLPTPTTVIQPEPAPEPEVIYLRHVERAAPKAPRGEQDRVYPPPQFIIPLTDQAQVEGNRVHFEARVEPVGDPTMNVQWYHNGKVLPASSRITTTFRFGFIALDMLSIVPEDAGEYACVVVSATGNAQSVAKLTVTGRVSIDQKSQYPDSLQYITQLEDYSKYQRSESVEELSPVRPQFIRQLKDLGQLQEGRNAHFEAQLTPVSDPTMRVDWFKDGKPITASSRITTIFNFGYVSLNILHLRAEDTGVYTVRAVNRWGEAVSQSSVTVISRSSVTADLGFPEQQRYIHGVEALEAYTQQAHVRQAYEPPESTSPPVFQTQVQDQLNVKEGGFAHFEARLEPVGDSTLKVEWLKDGRPVEASSRITTFFNFGYVALTIKHVATHDMGRYTCRAYNQLGEATTSANLTVISKHDIISDSQHSASLQKIQYLEESSRYMKQVQEETTVTQKPRFLGPLKGTNRIVEGQRAHFEARVEPLSDTTMKIDWYFNGKVLQTANRIQTYHDFGYVALDIESVRAEDAGTYTVVARNALGEAQLSASMQVETRAGIDTRSMHHGAYDKTKQIEQHRHVEPTYNIEEISKSKPIFVTPLSDPPPASEGKNIHLECRLEPMGDPTMRVEWFQNGKPITIGSRFRTYYDFGYVALDIVHVTSLDSGEYTVRATNHLGSAHTSACVRVMSRSDIVTESQNESSLEQIQYLEDSKQRRHVQEDVTIMSAPVFTRPLHNIETLEGTNIHLECRLQPVGDPTMRVDWFVNGKPVRVGHRFRPAFDFDYVALDLLSVYPEDSGVYTCQARNQLGEAVTSSSVRIIAKKDLILESQHPGGLEKIQYLEDASRYRRTDTVDEAVATKPRFVTKPKSIENMREGGHAHFECKLEPVTDSNLKVEWYKNGRPIIVGHRFRPIHDFGYVALDIIDVIEEDSGTYTCRATNMVGYDETSCSLKAKGTSQILTATQNEMGLEQIQYLEDRSRYQRSELIEETTTQAPVFTTSLKHCDIKEGQRAHFECRIIPVSDNTMKVEWFHNGQPVKSGSRFTETNNFGFVALDILHCLPEDSGTYTCRAKNINGEAVTSAILNVSSRKSIYLESQHESALSRLNQFEDRQYAKPAGPEETATQAPVFTQPMRDVRTLENQTIHFEARLIPVGDPRLKVEWLRNGVPIAASNRVSTMHDFGYVALNMKYVYGEDSGTYTCRAKNDLGEAVTSATLVVQSKASLLTESQHEAALQKLQALEDSTKYHRTEEQEVVVKEKPNFTVKLNGPSQLVEGQSAHYECRIEPYPDPNLKVEWFHNGQPLQTGHRFRTTYDFGFAALDILTVYEEDTGEYTCRATNKLGQAVSSVNLKVQGRAGIIRDTQHQEALQKIQYLESDSRYKRAQEEEVAINEKPQFGRPLKNIEHLPEGKQAHLEATLTPVNDPTMRVEWFRNGRPIPQGHRFKTVYDFGFVALDILYAYAEDSGTYMCKAKNSAGEAVTTCSVIVDSKAGLQLDTLDEQRLKKIKELEHYERPQAQEVEPEQQKPVFLTPLNSLENLKEGEHAHLECRVEPINDPNMKIEWFVNGKAIKTGHRFRTTHDFGYVALDILYSYAEDSGTYMCKATNKKGEAVNTSNIKVQSRHSILLETQHPEGLEKIRELEAQGHPQRLEIEEPLPTPPRFVTELRGTKEIEEGQTAHFEAQIEPLHDPNLRVEVSHNGKPLGSASRFHITFDFGYFALDIGHCLPSDAGEYTVKAVNKLGSCVSSTSLKVVEKGSIISESQRPEGLEKIRQLEAGPAPRAEVPEAVTRQRPVFTQPLQNIDGLAEGQNAHFECRLIPVGDPTLKVEWYRNEKLLEDSSRITKTHDFGFVSMDMTHVRDEDEGVYMCRASNALGEAVTTASMKIKSKASIQRETQHPEGMKKIQQLEEGKEPTRRDEPDQVFDKPIFTNLLTGPSELWEGQKAHFEARVVPVGDPTMRYLWFCNGVELKMGSRFHTTHDFGFVTLDIMSTVPEDSGLYMCKAINAAGEAVSSTTLKVKPRSAISGEPLQPDAWQKIQLKEAEMNKVPEGFQEITPQMPPVFTKHLSNAENLVEGSHVYLEALVEPKGDPNLRIEWFKNGKSITTGARIRSTFDFGLVTLSVNGVRPDDSAIYTCKATNLLGEAVSTCTIKVEDRHWLLANSLRPEALPLIDALEGPKETKGETAEPIFEGPVFISHLNNVVCTEGENSHFDCRVEPAKDPTLQIEFFANGKPLPSGARFKGAHDFGFVTLDINSCYAEDSGIYTVKATNSKGQASTSGTLKCTGKSDIYLQTQHPQGQAGLDKVQEVDDAYASKYQRQDSKPEAPYPKPVWTKPLEAEFKLGEAQPLHLEATVEPKEDPNLKIEWYFNGKALAHGSRFKMTSEFGFVTLDLIEVYERDQGIYTCKAWNKSGEAFTSTTIHCTTKESLIEKTQHPKGQEGLGKIQELEESLRREDAGKEETELGQAPQFTSQFQNISNLGEGEIAHFEASLIPVGDQTMKVEWFFNGKTIEASHRIRTVHAFGMVVLEILGTKIEDSGTYVCRATNKWGQAEISVSLECVDITKGQKPKFTTQIKSVTGLKDGDSVHFECTLIPVGDPSMRVEWFHNGRPIRHSTRIKQVSDFGFVLMDIAYTQSHDTGEYVCRAKNKYGEDFTRAHVECVGKGGVYYDTLQPDSLQKIRELEAAAAGHGASTPAPTVTEPPKFITQISDVTTLKEGQSAHFEARLTPVNDPNLTVEWFFNGKKLPHGHRYRTFHDFGIVILDILYCYAENTGEYECRATNLVGSDSTKAVLKCASKANLILTSQLPEGMEGGLEKIQSLEESMLRTREEQTSETKGQAPVFTVPLSNIDSLREGESAHFEARLTPTDDPKLKVEWFWNNKPLKTGSRFRTFCDFGFVILEISPVYPEDSGEYSCRASNEYGQAVTSSVMKVEGKRSIIIESQLPKGMEGTIDKIAELEGLGQLRPPVLPEDDLGKPPEFITQPSDLTLVEYSLAHFECRLTPINDPSLRVEWYHNGKPLTAGSRFKTINDFGFVILEISGVDTRDAGLYTCKATNNHGEAAVSCKLQVKGRQGIIMEPQLPNTFSSGTESIQKLEEGLHKKDEVAETEEKPNPPRFIVDVRDCEAQEGGRAHFDCRVEPVGDPTLRIDWFFNGRPFATGSRVHMINDFGFVVLDMEYTYARDAGEYICRASNKWGTATSKAKLICKAKHDVVLDSQLPTGMSGEKLKELERGKVTEPKPEEAAPAVPPKFVTQIASASVGEGEPVRFECKVEPKNDSTMKIEWYRNGKLLPLGHRFKTVFDMGFVSLDILYVYPEDTGDYVCRAVNAYGEDFTKATIACKKIPSIILQNQVPRGMKKSEALMQMEATIKKYTSEVHLTEEDLYEPEKKQPPRFVTQIQDQTDLVEMEATKFECQLAPVGDPNMKVEWFYNGKPLHHKNRFTPIYDFGYVAMNFGWVYPEDSGEYLCRATNLYGMDETRAIIKTAGKPGIIYDSQLPKGMKSIEKIRELESSWLLTAEEKVEEEKAREAPIFVSKPEPCTVQEGDCARFCCRVTGYPRPRVVWLINDHTVVNGARCKLTYDGMWHLDIPKTRQYDTGTVTVVARNSSGEARVDTKLTVTPRGDDYRGVLKNSPRQTMGTKLYKKPEWVVNMEEMQEKLKAEQITPCFIREITDSHVKTEETVVFDAQFTGNPQPVVIWYHNDKLLRATENIEISIKDNRSTVVIKRVKEGDAGTYVCKASSNIGEAISTAQIKIVGYGEVTEEEVQEIKEETVQVRKTEKKKKKKVKQVTREEPEKDSIDVEEVQPLESTAPFTETTESAIAERTFDIQESVEVSAVASCKKVSDEQDFPTDVPDTAQVVAPVQESVTITETVPEDKTVELTVAGEKTEKAEVTRTEQRSVTVSQTVTESAVSDLVTETRIETKATESTETLQTAQVSRTTVSVSEIEEALEGLNVKEFGPWQAPLRELAKVDVLRKKGVSVEEVLTLYDTGELPALKTAPAQNALVSLVERVGHSSLISEMVTQEETLEGTLKGVFKAFLTMVDLRSATVQEVIPLFRPRDFQTPHWETVSTMPVITEETATETVTETNQVEVQEMKIITQKKTRKVEETKEEEASLQITKLLEESGEMRIIETTEGSPLFSICSYVAETDDALNLVEGEKVYVIESNNSDWWYVKKHLTEEKGWVPAVYLRDEPSYTLYVQKKLHEKIDRLPIFEKPGPGTNVFAPKFVEKLQPKRVVDGGVVQFECKVEGNPRPQITWFRQTAIIKPSHDFQIFYDDDNVATLIINEVFPEDAGTFTCVAKNAAGFASSTTELVVESPLSEHGSDTTGLSRKSLSRESSLADILEGIPPTFSRKPKAKLVPLGSDVELEVRLVAIPEPEIQWFLKNKPVVPSANVTIVTQSDMHMYANTMKISKVTRGQEGVYTVVAKNREGEASVDIILKIKTGEPEAPTIVDMAKDVSLTEGETIVLSAQVTGSPTPKVVWLKDGRPVKLETSITGDTHTAVVRNAKPGDSGNYTLEAVNPQGKASSTAKVTVQDRKHQAPLFVERFEEVQVSEKGTIRLTAKVDGNPIPSVTWFRNNKILLASPRITEMFDGEQILLEIVDADSEEDAGDYKCVATNAIGSATNGAKVTVDVAKVYFTKKLPSKYEVDENKTVVLECETSHTVSTTWYHDKKELSGMDNRELVQEGRTQRLVIKKASRKDKGTYACAVKDQTTETKLIVHEVKPDFVRKIDDFEVKELQVAILEVEVTSDAAEVIWEKDGLQLESKPGKIEMEKRGPVHKLLIRSTSVHDEGEYTCRLDDKQCSAEVTVIELPPEILTHMQDTTVPRGEKACLEVELTKGDALVRWFKDDVELQFSEHVQLSIDGKRQKLKIYQADDTDGGVYSCRVGDQVSTARLTVEAPKVEFITRLPDVTMIPVGSDAEFAVELSTPDVDVKWLRKGKEIKPSERFVITANGAKRKLVIKKVTLEDQTDITCMAMNIKTTSKLKIEVIETAPKIIAGPKEYKVKKGEDVTFTVKFSGSPKPSEEWTVNGTVVKPSKRVVQSSDDESASLTIKKIEETDVGNYTIKLKNNVGEASAELTLIIVEVPSAPGVPEIVEVTDSSVTVTWKEPSSDGNSPIESYILEYHDKEEFLTWHDITNITERTHKVTGLARGHEVNFRASAVNSVGKGPASDSSRYAKVETPGSTVAPSFKEPLTDKSCGLAKSITLSCVVAGIPDPDVKWFKDGKALKTKTISYTNHVAKLVIEKVVESSSGTYNCKATNTAGSAETSCKLVVQEVPSLKIDDEAISQRLELRSQWKPTVEVSGYPTPEIAWAKDGIKLVTDKRVTTFVDEKSTTIAIYSTDRKDSGTYTVTATNIAGSTTLDLKLKVIDKPSKPEAVVIKDVDGESATIEWKPPADDGGVDISKYSLEKCDASKLIWTKVADIERDARCYVVQRLQANAEYMFRIFAQNPVGTSEPAETSKVEITSKLGKPSAPTRPVEISGMSDKSCTITWGEPESDGGAPIIDYSIERKETDSKDWVKIGTTKERQIIVTELKKGKTYDFRIFARNRIGSGPPVVEENITAGTQKTPPSPPNSIAVLNIASKSVTLQWEPPLSNGGSELTDYVIEKQDSQSNKWTKVVTLDANVLKFTVENLKEKSELYFRVFAENAVGLSLPTTTSLVSLKTHATVPSPPTAPLEMRSTGANSVMVSWGVPESDGGAPIEGYKIAVRDIKKTMWMEVGRVGADIQKLTIKDLQENHEYLIRIYARNEVGLSDPLESDEPFKVQRPTAGGEDYDVEDSRIDKETPSLSFTTTTQSWMREAGMDADIHSYSQGALLRRSEYFFRIWYYAKHLFK